MSCRLCGAALTKVFVDLGTAPPSNAYLEAGDASKAETFYPLRVFACERCFLVQLEAVTRPEEIFSASYAYFSSYATSWLAHAEAYARAMIARLGLGPGSFVCEIASNDGYLLRNFVAAGVPCLGIEPTANTAAVARTLGVDTWTAFFGEALAGRVVSERRAADLVVGNNVLAHVPDLRDFLAGVRVLLAPAGLATFEFPHLAKLVAEVQFDTIYHEHFSYFSLVAAARAFRDAGLRVFDVEELPTHGGSLRVYVAHAEAAFAPTARLAALEEAERAQGFASTSFCEGFPQRVERVKDDVLSYLLEAKRTGRRVCAYGAAAKGNTLLNYAGVRADLLPFVVDASPHKQGRLLPGSRIPVVSEAELRAFRPDDVLILPWNLRAEISQQLSYVGAWGGRFVTAVPSLSFWEARPT